MGDCVTTISPDCNCSWRYSVIPSSAPGVFPEAAACVNEEISTTPGIKIAARNTSSLACGFQAGMRPQQPQDAA
jgi:hypothetical protein